MRRRSWPSGGAGLGGLTMSEDGGLDEVEESSSPQRVAAGDQRQWPRAPSTAQLGRPTSPASADSSGKTSVPWVSWWAMLHPWSRIHNTGERLRFGLYQGPGQPVSELIRFLSRPFMKSPTRLDAQVALCHLP